MGGLLDLRFARPRVGRRGPHGCWLSVRIAMMNSKDDKTRLATVGSHADGVHLEGLTVEGVEELIRFDPGPAGVPLTRFELHRGTGGHPLFVSELARMRADWGLDRCPRW